MREVSSKACAERGALKVLPIQLLNRTQYLKEDAIFEVASKIKAVRYPEELTSIVQCP